LKNGKKFKDFQGSVVTGHPANISIVGADTAAIYRQTCSESSGLA